MTTTDAAAIPLVRKQIVPNKVFAMLIFVTTEIMFFTAIISAFLVMRGEGWSLPSTVRLPVAATGYNTAVLILSGVLIFLVGRHGQISEHFAKARTLLGWSIVFGAFFVIFQGFEWAALISYGMTMRSSIFGACFFLVIGSHALHVIAGLTALIYLYATSTHRFERDTTIAVQIFWYFVVGIWPLLYGLVYF